MQPQSAIERSLRTEFFQLLFGEREGFFCMCTASPHKKDFKQFFFEWPAQNTDIQEAVERAVTERKNVWFCVNLLSEPKRQKEFALPHNLLWADLDHANPTDISPPPQVVMESSLGRYQALWLIEETLDPYAASDYSKRIAYAYRDKGVDLSGWDLTQLLRVPFTGNYKYPNVPPIKLLRAIDDPLPIGVFDALAEAPSLHVEDAYKDSCPDVDKLPSVEQVLYAHRGKLATEKFLEQFYYEPSEDDDWSDLLWRFINTCLEKGLDNEETFALTRATKFDKYARDNRPPYHLWKDILKAEQNQIQIDRQIKEIGASFGMPELIPGELYSSLPKTIIDEYREWAVSATDAVPAYHDLCCFILLSALTAGNLKLETSYGSVRPNLWGMILGDSTLTRKSTAMRMATDFIAQIDRDIVLATDGSAEGLLSGLQTRSGQTSLFFKDEVAGLFESFRKKDYLAGMPEMLTQLYDVPEFFQRRLRKEIISVSNPLFIFFGGGIRDKMFTLIDDGMIMSGFLPRFLIVTGDTNLSSIRRTGPPTPDVALEKKKLLGDFHDLYRKYSQLHEVEILGQRALQPLDVGVHFPAEAWELYGDIEFRMVEAASNSPNPTIALPTFERLSRSLLKMAVLVAATRHEPDNGELVGTVEDIKIAAKYVEQWGWSSVEMLVNIGRTVATRTMEKVRTLIAQHPGIARSVIMRTMNLTKREMDEIQNTLEERGDIMVRRSSKAITFIAL